MNTGSKTTTRLYHLHALTPLHIGAGRGEGYIDLPLVRERSTELPVVPGSAIKGVLRYEHTPPEAEDADLSPAEQAVAKAQRAAANTLFGKAPGRDGEEASGLLRVSDARLLCLPVRSWRGVFAWATCPLILHRYRRDLADTGETAPAVPRIEKDDEALVVTESELVLGGDRIYFEDMNLRACQTGDLAKAWAAWIAERVFSGDADWKEEFAPRFAILPDTLFVFLAEHATELRAHVQLTEKRTVGNGPWYEESLPAESLLWGLMGLDVYRSMPQADATADLLVDIQQERRLQIGGSATAGLGQVRWVLSSGMKKIKEDQAHGSEPARSMFPGGEG